MLAVHIVLCCVWCVVLFPFRCFDSILFVILTLSHYIRGLYFDVDVLILSWGVRDQGFRLCGFLGQGVFRPGCLRRREHRLEAHVPWSLEGLALPSGDLLHDAQGAPDDVSLLLRRRGFSSGALRAVARE